MAFNTFDDLETFIDAYIRANGVLEITGTIHNSAEIGLLDFIRQSPLNWQKAKIESGGGIISVSRPISIFMTSTPTSVNWPDNIYNEYVFINTTSNDIPLTQGFVYYDINLFPLANIRAKSEVNIVKASNNLWVQRNSGSGRISGIVPVIFVKKVDGQPGSPIAGLTTYQNDELKNAIGVEYIIVNKGIEDIEDGDFTFDVNGGLLDRKPNVWVTGDSLIMTFWKYLTPPVVPTNPSIEVYFTNVDHYDLAWTPELILQRGNGAKFAVYMDFGNGRFDLTTVPTSVDNIINPTNYHFDFPGPSSGVIVF